MLQCFSIKKLPVTRYPLRVTGFTLLELLVALGLLSLFTITAVSLFSALTRVTGAARSFTRAAALANEQIEIIRNLPYTDVGTTQGIPRGKVPSAQTIARDGDVFTVTATIRNTDDPFDGTIGGTPNDTAPADYKWVEIAVTCAACESMPTALASTIVAPKNLETSSGNGALFIHVIDALGAPVMNAHVHVENKKLSPNLIIDEVTDNNGWVQLVDIPPSVGGYNISVTKQGYTSDGTYPSGQSENPNPEKTDSTVLKEQVTQTSFTIDRVSTIDLSTITNRCTAIGSVSGKIEGQKKISVNPDTLKYTATFTTNVDGKKTLENVVWDPYTATITDDAYSFAGAIPKNPVVLAPNERAPFDLILEPASTKNLLVTVTDALTRLPLGAVTVTLKKGSQSTALETGKGFVSQTDWSGGGGQPTFIDHSRFATDDGNIDVITTPGDVLLRRSQGGYAANGALESSTIDFGGSPSFITIRALPFDQPNNTLVRMQIATNNDLSTWNYRGPDGTAQTFYTSIASTIARMHDGDRYLRYRLFLSSTNPASTPNVSEIQLIFSASCVPPGQTYFGNLSGGQYTLLVEKEGYEPYEETVQVSGPTTHAVDLAP